MHIIQATLHRAHALAVASYCIGAAKNSCQSRSDGGKRQGWHRAYQAWLTAERRWSEGRQAHEQALDPRSHVQAAKARDKVAEVIEQVHRAWQESYKAWVSCTEFEEELMEMMWDLFENDPAELLDRIERIIHVQVHLGETSREEVACWDACMWALRTAHDAVGIAINAYPAAMAANFGEPEGLGPALGYLGGLISGKQKKVDQERLRFSNKAWEAGIADAVKAAQGFAAERASLFDDPALTLYTSWAEVFDEEDSDSFSDDLEDSDEYDDLDDFSEF